MGDRPQSALQAVFSGLARDVFFSPAALEVVFGDKCLRVMEMR